MEQADSASLANEFRIGAEERDIGHATDVGAFDLELFRQLVEMIDVVPYTWDLGAERFTYVAPWVVNLLGFPPEAWLDRAFLASRVAPEHRQRFLEAARTFQTDPKDSDGDFCYLAADGRRVWVRDITRLATDPEGHQICLGVMIDVTERREAEEAVSDSQALLRSLIDAIPASVNVKDLDGRYVLVNRAYADRHKRSIEDFIGRTAIDMFDRHYARRIMALDRAVLDSAEPTGFHERLQRLANGAHETWLASKVPLLDARGKIGHIAGIALDISDRKRTQEALEKSEAKYRAIVENQTELVTRSGPSGALTFVNKAYLDYFGATPDQILGRSFLNHVPEEDKALIHAHLERLTPENPTATVEHRSHLANGEIRWQFWTDHAFFDEAGQIVEIQSVGRDITDLKNAERALQASEERHRRLVESANMIPYAVNLDTMKFAYVGPQITRVLGYPIDRLVESSSWIACIHPDDRAAAVAGSVLAKPHEPAHTLEYRMIAADGRIVWIREYSTNERSHDGTWFEYGLVFDITEQKQTELALKESESKYRAVVEDQTEFVVRFEPGGIMTFVNPAFCRQLGLDRDRLIGQSWYAFLPDDDRVSVDAQLATISPGNPIVAIEHRSILPNGEIRWESWTNRGIFDGDGRVVAYQAVGRDITDQKLAEERLRESERRFRHLVESTDVVPYTMDVGIGRFTYVGPQAVGLLGYPVEDWSGEDFWESILHPDERERLITQWKKIKSIKGDENQEYRVVRKDGTTIWVRDVLRLEVDDSGRTVAYGLMVNITDNKHREEQLRQAQKMDIVGQMTGGVAHDFNNLLTVIIGNLHLLERNVGSDPTASRRLNLIRGAAERGAELTKGLLAFARRQTLQGKLTDVNALVSGMMELLRRTLGEGIQIDLRLGEDLWSTIVDPAQLESVLVNLAVNARDAMGSSGTLVVETANELVDVGDGNVRPFVMLAVRDTGCGMPPEVLAKVFEPFFTTKPVGQGTGLGLSMVYGTVKQSGGRIEIDSEVGNGTTVRIYLPRAGTTGDGAPEEAARTPGSPGNATILLVEPEADSRNAARSILTSLGHRVMEADGASAALSMLETNGHAIDLMITNLTMPGNMSGVVLAHEAARHAPQMKVLFCSNAFPGGTGRTSILKPYVPEDLRSKVRAALTGAREP